MKCLLPEKRTSSYTYSTLGINTLLRYALHYVTLKDNDVQHRIIHYSGCSPALVDKLC